MCRTKNVFGKTNHLTINVRQKRCRTKQMLYYTHIYSALRFKNHTITITFARLESVLYEDLKFPIKEMEIQNMILGQNNEITNIFCTQ